MDTKEAMEILRCSIEDECRALLEKRAWEVYTCLATSTIWIGGDEPGLLEKHAKNAAKAAGIFARVTAEQDA